MESEEGRHPGILKESLKPLRGQGNTEEASTMLPLRREIDTLEAMNRHLKARVESLEASEEALGDKLELALEVADRKTQHTHTQSKRERETYPTDVSDIYI